MIGIEGQDMFPPIMELLKNLILLKDRVDNGYVYRTYDYMFYESCVINKQVFRFLVYVTKGRSYITR